MDEQDGPLTQRPIGNHPNSVHGESTEPADELPPTPKHYEPLPPQYQKGESKKGRNALIILAILLLVGGLVYWFLLKPKPVKAPTTSEPAASSAKSSQSKASEIETQHHESPSFNLGFNYPKGWSVSDISGSDKVTVTSPAMKLKGADSQQIDGQIVMAIRGKTQKLSEFDKGAAAAILDSEKIAYTKPAETQRGNTYISFLNYASSTGSNASGIDGIYITGDAGYQKDQAVPATDISKIDPIINVVFVKCSDSKCSGTGMPLTVDTSEWQNPSISKPVKAMLQSLSIQ
jgi:hypothetical protein